MAHEIERHDHVVLHRERAWHGLGTIVQDAPTPAEALKLARLDWNVEQWALSATDGISKIAVGNMVANVRTDVRHVLGVVSTHYQPVQNRDLADFAEALAQQGDVVKIESAGSIRNGAKVWFLLKGESFSVRAKDEVTPYILVSNGHDGGTALRCTPTTVRVVCSNTLHMVIPRFDLADRQNVRKIKAGCYVARHIGDVKQKVAEARQALGLYQHSLASQREVIDHLAARDINRQDLTRFLTECYTKHIGEIPANAATAKEQQSYRKAVDGIVAMLGRFERESQHFGANYWTALNAYTGWLQHERQPRRRNAEARREATIGSNLLGLNADRSVEAMGIALAA